VGLWHVLIIERPSISTLPAYCADMHVQHPHFQLVHKVIGW
jgi:hypothetical protein